MSYPLALANIVLITLLNIGLTVMATMYQTLGYGLNPFIAAVIGTIVTVVLLAVLAYTGIEEKS